MKKTIITLLIAFSSSIVLSQITIGTSLDRANPEKEIIKAPTYENHQNFLSYEEYYGYNPPIDKTPTKEEFYSRYNDLKIFFPKYSNDYREKSVIIFEEDSSINLKKREFLNEKYYKIVRIDEEFGKTHFFGKINESYKEYLEAYLLFTLKDENTGKNVYVVESKISFVLVPFYENLSEFFSEISFIANQDFGADKLPLSKTNGNLYIDKGTEWKGRFSLLRGRDINYFPEEKVTNEDQDLKYIAIFPAGSKLSDSKGNVLPDCFLLPPGSTALDFAYHLHSDIGDRFVKAIDVKTKQPVGRDHPLKNRDGIEIMTN